MSWNINEPMKEDTLLQHQPGMHAAFVEGSAIQMQNLRPTYINAKKSPLYNSHHRINLTAEEEDIRADIDLLATDFI